ncbi:NmrA family NAD(P)-binding protein [Streptomyces sp. NPDC101152]|uniref:NmrA family NAD(P)-binding protein n=1 Tax=Streptomyces sp. NPDC101152 TaxID=3366116 RepID=UPI003816AB6C
MSPDSVITVLGATGTQGAVARALLADGAFTVRAVTRDATSPKAQAPNSEPDRLPGDSQESP